MTIRRAVVYYVRAAHTFSAVIKCQHCRFHMDYKACIHAFIALAVVHLNTKYNSLRENSFNPSNAEATFVQSTQMQGFLKII